MTKQPELDLRALEALYQEADYWHVNTGGKTIHAKRMSGRYRTYKWLAMSVWLTYFFGPYMRWEGRQAILFDIPARQFHIFGITLLPQDVWMLAMVLLFFALLLAAVTSIVGRAYCGYFCFQTVWTDIFVWIEQLLEGPPLSRTKLDRAAWTFTKFRIKFIKHFLWLVIGLFTGITFTLWFADAYVLWSEYATFQAPLVAWGTVFVFTIFTHLFAGHMREQVCFWLCPYARIQGVMVDRETILPTYDLTRGEPRGKLKKTADRTSDLQTHFGDCIDCKQCIAVCPTGIDIRHGQQEGCITCGLCLDACDAIMEKIHRPKGLIRYVSLDELEGKLPVKIYQRPRVIIYSLIMLAALVGIIYGLTTIAPIELKVLHERQPLFVKRSDGTIQNKYELKVLNKTNEEMTVKVTVHGHDSLQLIGADELLTIANGRLKALTVYLRVTSGELEYERMPVQFRVEDVTDHQHYAEYNSVFFGPKKAK